MKLVVKNVTNFKRNFDEVIKKGLPNFWDRNNELYPLEKYKENMKNALKDYSKVNEVGLPIIEKTFF